MPVQLLAVVAISLTLLGCYPDKPCAGELVFDESTALCYECPKGAKYRDQTCDCGEGYDYVGGACQLRDGAMPAAADGGVDAAAYQGAGCKDYCAFATTCVGGNAIAPTVLADVVMGLHADDAAECESSCNAELGSAEATDPAVACIAAGKDAAMCSDPNPQTGLVNTFGLIGQCCGPNLSSPLCMSICATLKASPVAGSMVPFCG